jgi:hypothetical protein
VSDPCTVEEVQEGVGGKNTPVRITICQGKNRQVRGAPRYGWTCCKLGKDAFPANRSAARKGRCGGGSSSMDTEFIACR